MPRRQGRRLGFGCVALLLGTAFASAQGQPDIVKASQKISNLAGGLGMLIDAGDVFGNSYLVGDVNGDGLDDVAIGAGGSDDGVVGAGAIWLMTLDTAGIVASASKISSTFGGFGGLLDTGDAFGSSVSSVGDIDGDGVMDIAVGARGDTDGAAASTWRGAVWILRMNVDRTVKAWSKINESNGGFTGVFDDYEYFGSGLASLGDLNGDGICDVAVGARSNSPGQAGDGNGGSVWILFLDATGGVISHTEISNGMGGFQGTLDNGDQFGNAVSNIGDFDGDGVVDIAVGVKRDDDGGVGGSDDYGAVYVLLLNTDGTVKAEQKISLTQGNFQGSVTLAGFFGTTVTSVGDLDGDGVTDLAVGAKGDSDGSPRSGSTFLLFMNADSTVRTHAKISETAGGFREDLDTGDFFGSGLTCIGDLDLDGAQDLLVGARTDDDGGLDAGAVYVIFLDGSAWAAPVADFDVSPTSGLAPLQTTFTDTSSGAVSTWNWDFGDGSTASVANPLHNYLAEGLYSTSLTVSGVFGSDTIVYEDIVFVSDDMAIATQRNGTGLNPLIFSSVTLPLLDEDWQSAVDVTGFPNASLVALVALESPLSALTLPQGELLVDVLSAPYLSVIAVPSSGTASFSVSLPLDLSLPGLPVFNQCVVFSGAATLTNAVDLVLGL
ncbi:MAG: PKD repeat protein [Planctomycetota bacterium]|jgi:PKD repeat protein